MAAFVGMARRNGPVVIEMATPRDREPVRLEGTVTEALPAAMFRVTLGNGRVITAHVGAELRLHLVRLLPGDKVILELASYDPSRGRIVQRV